jgi:hypothetical protein
MSLPRCMITAETVLVNSMVEALVYGQLAQVMAGL